MTVTTDGIQQRWRAVMMNSYGTPPIALQHGRGCRVTDAEGTEYLDFIAGIAVSSLGHAHPAIVRAVSEQVETLAHTSNLFINLPALQLAEKLKRLSGAPDANLSERVRTEDQSTARDRDDGWREWDRTAKPAGQYRE
jgi:acetylornithine/N-succinyldiaminopimelate aminotransferase